MPRSPQEAIDRVGQIAGLLLHPRAARLRMDPGDGHAAGLQLDHEEERILDRHPDHERGDFAARHRPPSTAAGAAVVFLGDQSPVPAKDRVRGDDARDLPEDSPAEFVAAHSESPTLGVGQAKRPRAQVFPEDPILLPEILDQIVLVAVHPASEREDEEL